MLDFFTHDGKGCIMRFAHPIGTAYVRPRFPVWPQLHILAANFGENNQAFLFHTINTRSQIRF